MILKQNVLRYLQIYKHENLLGLKCLIALFDFSNVDLESVSERVEDEDVARERRRVLSDQTNNDVLRIKELVKVRQ